MVFDIHLFQNFCRRCWKQWSRFCMTVKSSVPCACLAATMMFSMVLIGLFFFLKKWDWSVVLYLCRDRVLAVFGASRL